MASLLTAVHDVLPQVGSVLVKGSRFMKMEQVVEALAAATQIQTHKPAPAAPAPAPISAVIRVMSGAAAGREVSLQKVVTTIGKPGVAVASITKRHQGFVLAHVEGPEMPLLNGAAIGASPVPLKHGDRLELAGTEMQFEQT